ncbi:Magnesium transporter MRS2-I-like protein [Drosera capensis]
MGKKERRAVFAEETQWMNSTMKKTTVSSKQSWILLNSQGQGAYIDVDKYEIMGRVDINARDLRILDTVLSYPSTILGRDKAIVLNLENNCVAGFVHFMYWDEQHIKAIITADEVLLRDPSDENVIPVVEELQRQLRPKHNKLRSHHVDAESPFEFRALEVTLEAICSFLDARTTELETDAYPTLDALTSKISSRNMDRVRKVKSAMTRLTVRVQKVRDKLEQLLDDDDDMADFYLTRKLYPSSPGSETGALNGLQNSSTALSKISKASRASAMGFYGDEHDIEELEMLLEAYFTEIDGTLNRLTTLREYINDTEAYIYIQLESKRNRLIQLELFLNSGTLVLAICSLVTGIFGVNIPYTWNKGYGYMFKWVLTVTGASCASLFALIIVYARRKGLVGS